jgi:hypothetical protein
VQRNHFSGNHTSFQLSSIFNIIGSKLISSEADNFWREVVSIHGNISQRRVLVIAEKFEAGSVADVQMKKILGGGCGLSDSDYNLFFLEQGETASWAKIFNLYKPQIAFIFGISHIRLGIASLFKLNQPNFFYNIQVLPTVSLMELERNVDLKKDLWTNGIKPLFSKP